MAQKKRFSPRKAKLISQLPLVAAGKKTKEKAMLDAGYAKSTARQQNVTFGYIRQSMPEALRNAGVTEESVANRISNGMQGHGPVGLGYTKLAVSILLRTSDSYVDDTYPHKDTEELWQEFCGIVERLASLRTRISGARQSGERDDLLAEVEVESEPTDGSEAARQAEGIHEL